MDFELNQEDRDFQKEVNEFLKGAITQEVTRECMCHGLHGPHTRELMRKLGAKGWIGISWPKEYGGQSGSIIKDFIVADALMYNRGPLERYAVDIVGTCLLRRGSEELKREFLPRITKGEIEFCLGFTEPEAGSDLASLETRAVRNGDNYIINGHKIFTTGAQASDYVWLATRTNLKAPKHKGISVFIVDLINTPGITIQPIFTLSGERTNEVWYDNVVVPKKWLVGKEDEGWMYIVESLSYARIALYSPGRSQRNFEELMQLVKATKRGGKTASQDPLVRQKLAQMRIKLEISRLLWLKCAWMLSNNMTPYCEAAILKIFYSELYKWLPALGMEILGLYGQLDKDSMWAPLQGWLEHQARDAVLFTIGDGANEILRDYVARRGLGLPRAYESV